MKSRPRAYVALINTTKWQRLRRAYIVEQPLCERCLSEGRTTTADVVHHIDPLEDHLANPTLMRALAYDWTNLRSLCHDCHGRTHSELRSRSREAHQARAKATTELFAKRWLERLDSSEEWGQEDRG